MCVCVCVCVCGGRGRKWIAFHLSVTSRLERRACVLRPPGTSALLTCLVPQSNEPVHRSTHEQGGKGRCLRAIQNMEAHGPILPAAKSGAATKPQTIQPNPKRPTQTRTAATAAAVVDNAAQHRPHTARRAIGPWPFPSVVSLTRLCGLNLQPRAPNRSILGRQVRGICAQRPGRGGRRERTNCVQTCKQRAQPPAHHIHTQLFDQISSPRRPLGIGLSAIRFGRISFTTMGCHFLNWDIVSIAISLPRLGGAFTHTGPPQSEEAAGPSAS